MLGDELEFVAIVGCGLVRHRQHPFVKEIIWGSEVCLDEFLSEEDVSELLDLLIGLEFLLLLDVPFFCARGPLGMIHQKKWIHNFRMA